MYSKFIRFWFSNEVASADCFFVLFLLDSFLNDIIRILSGQSVFHSPEALEKLLDTNDTVLFCSHTQALEVSTLVRQSPKSMNVNNSTAQVVVFKEASQHILTGYEQLVN